MADIGDIDYILPEELIAVKPAGTRGMSRLLIVSRKDNSCRNAAFPDLLTLLKPGDCLVFNNTKVFKARLYGSLSTGKIIEILLVEKLSARRWTAMVKHSKKIPEGSIINIAEIQVRVLEKIEDLRVLEFPEEMSFDSIDQIGQVPLPPYIVKKRKKMEIPEYMDEDPDWYQSVLADKKGSVAAPTASLHFTEEFLKQAEEAGVRKVFVTLHVGPGTFKPIDTDLDVFQIHREYAEVPLETIQILQETRRNGGRIIAVGTTVVRTLETMARDSESPDLWRPFDGHTQIFIKDDFKFKVTDILVTNFHMPKSTLLLLVQSFGGKELLKKAYVQAVAERYRFFSYGDAMVIY